MVDNRLCREVPVPIFQRTSNWPGFAAISGQPAILALALIATLLSTANSSRASASDDLEARRAQIAHMPPAEQQELLRKQERFAALPQEEQKRLRALQTALEADPQAQKLHEVLERYHEWLKTLSPTQRAELADLAPAERIQQIKRIQKLQHAAREQTRQAELLTRQDVREIVKWTEDFAWQHRQELLTDVPEQQRKFFEKEGPRQKQMLLFRAMASERSRRGGTGALALMEQADVDHLTEKLSDAAKQELAEAGDLSAQRRRIGGWIGTAMRLDWRGGRRLGPAMGDDLVQFLQHDVPRAERQRLLSLPHDQMIEELRGLYFGRGRGAMGQGGPGGSRHENRSDFSKGPRGGDRRAKADDGPPKSVPDAPAKP
jgi:hypothetical protein